MHVSTYIYIYMYTHIYIIRIVILLDVLLLGELPGRDHDGTPILSQRLKGRSPKATTTTTSNNNNNTNKINDNNDNDNDNDNNINGIIIHIDNGTNNSTNHILPDIVLIVVC